MDSNKSGQTTHVSSGGPEQAPAISNQETIHQVIEHTPSEEIRSTIEHRPETVAIPQDLKNVGVESTGVPTFTNIDPLHLPLSDREIFEARKGKISSAYTWLANLCDVTLRKMNQTLKLVHGKVMRIKTP